MVYRTFISATKWLKERTEGRPARQAASILGAVNYKCTGCTSFAYAFQQVIQVPAQETLSESARNELSVLSGQMRSVLQSTAPASVMNAELATIAAQATSTVSANLKPVAVDGTSQQSASDG